MARNLTLRFPVPDGYCINMDVKFSLDNYENYLNATSEVEKSEYKDRLLKNLRARFNEVTTKDYKNSDTLDFVLLFIPNESAFQFVHEHDPKLIEDAIKEDVILLSPATLIAALAIIRQSANAFNVKKAEGEISRLLREFKTQWHKYFVPKMETLGNVIASANKHFGELSDVRTRKLESPLNEVERIEEEQGFEFDSGTTKPERRRADSATDDRQSPSSPS